MRHAGTQTLETDRLFLRQLLPEDAEQMYTNWASDPEVTRFLRWEPHKNALETVGLLAAWATLYPNPDYYQWAIVEKASGQVFGSISIFNALLGDLLDRHPCVLCQQGENLTIQIIHGEYSFLKICWIV